MSFQAKKAYNVDIIGCELIESPNKGTPGIQLMLECDEGFLSHVLWLTPKTVDRIEELLVNTFGIDPDKLKSMSYLENGLRNDLVGSQCSITTDEEEYNGKRRVVVRWINPPKKHFPNTSGSVASLFRRGADGPAKPSLAAVADDDTPF